MAKKPVLTDIGNINTGASVINANNTKVEDAFDNTLSLDGSTPNNMGADLDMNSNDILNTASVDTVSLTVNGVLFEGQLSFAGDWVGSTEYKRNEIVLQENVLYIAILNHTSGPTFSVGLNWDIFLSSTQGPTGNAGITFSTTEPISPSLNDLWLDIS